MTRQSAAPFLRAQRLAVLSTVAETAIPEAALVGIAVTDDFEIAFDTSRNSRKFANLRANPRVALVIGWSDEISVQYEGCASFPEGSQLEHFKSVYFAVFPDGPEREHWPDIVYVAIKPTWIRYRDFKREKGAVAEFTFV